MRPRKRLGHTTPEYRKWWVMIPAPHVAQLTLESCCLEERTDLWQPLPRHWRGSVLAVLANKASRESIHGCPKNNRSHGRTKNEHISPSPLETRTGGILHVVLKRNDSNNDCVPDRGGSVHMTVEIPTIICTLMQTGT